MLPASRCLFPVINVYVAASVDRV